MPALLQAHTTGILRPRLLPTGQAIVAPMFNSADKGALATLSNGDRTISTSAGASWWTARTLLSKSTGKWHAEMVLGVINAGSSALFGVCAFDAATNTYLGSQGKKDIVIQGNAGGTCYYWNGAGQFAASGITAATAGQRATVSVDFDAGKVWLGINGVYHNSGNPAAGTNATATFTANSTLFFAASVYDTSTGTLVIPLYTPSGFSNLA